MEFCWPIIVLELFWMKRSCMESPVSAKSEYLGLSAVRWFLTFLDRFLCREEAFERFYMCWLVASRLRTSLTALFINYENDSFLRTYGAQAIIIVQPPQLDINRSTDNEKKKKFRTNTTKILIYPDYSLRKILKKIQPFYLPQIFYAHYATPNSKPPITS